MVDFLFLRESISKGKAKKKIQKIESQTRIKKKNQKIKNRI